MKKRSLLGLLVVLSTTIVSATHIQAPGKWTVTIKTSGGFTGRGTGGIIATSDGNVATGRFASLTCRRQLTPADLESLRRAVADADPAAWSPSYVRASNPHGCCDQFRYSMTLDVQDAKATPTKYSTFWYSEMSNALPADVRGLFDAAWKMKKEADAICK